jgi:trimeric autotransporter adhesin
MLKQFILGTIFSLLTLTVWGQDVLKVGTDRFIHMTGTQSLFIGSKTGASNSGQHNTSVGQESGLANSIGSYNTFFGSNTGKFNTSGNANTFVGYAAGSKNIVGESNSFVGFSSGLNTTSGYANAFLGRSSGEANTVGYANTFIGHASGLKSTTAYNNAFLGYYAGSENVSGLENTFIGGLAGGYNVQGGSNTFVGYASGWRNTASDNVAVGRSAGAFNTSGAKNTFVGTLAGLGVEGTNVGSNNTFIGERAGLKISSGSNNTFIGKSVGSENTTGSGSTFLGLDAGAINSSGSNNTFVGLGAGLSNTTGNNNTFIGLNAGFENVTGSNNLFLGRAAASFGSNKANLQNAVAIGLYARVSVNDAIVLGDFQNNNLKVGIGVHDPQYRFEVSGDINIRKNGSVPGRLRFSSRNFIHADEQDYLVLTAAQLGQSGLRFANLTNQAAPVGVAGQFLSVDAEGRVGLYQPTLSARQVRLQVANPREWADHVFAADYLLPSLKAVGQYIQTNGHLPHLPSAQTMTDQGATMEELVKGLVKTQEEQTRYLLQLQADNEQLRKENAEIRALLKQVIEKK